MAESKIFALKMMTSTEACEDVESGDGWLHPTPQQRMKSKQKRTATIHNRAYPLLENRILLCFVAVGGFQR